MSPAIDPNAPDRFQVTEWAHPDDRIRTTEGLICYNHMLQREVSRWYHKNFRNAWLQANEHGEVAMFTDDPAMVAIEEHVVIEATPVSDLN